jgi:hypothetical protein
MYVIDAWNDLDTVKVGERNVNWDGPRSENFAILDKSSRSEPWR